MTRYVAHVAFDTHSDAQALKIASFLAKSAASNSAKKTEVMGPFVLSEGKGDPILAYCDGACSRKAGGWGYRIELDGGSLIENCGGQADTTNNQMELEALIRCVDELPAGRRCVVYTDSKYVQPGWTQWLQRWLQRGWRTYDDKPVKNRQYWQRLIAVMGKKPDVELRWVKGHNGALGNERADELAVKGMTPFLVDILEIAE